VTDRSVIKDQAEHARRTAPPADDARLAEIRAKLAGANVCPAAHSNDTDPGHAWVVGQFSQLRHCASCRTPEASLPQASGDTDARWLLARVDQLTAERDDSDELARRAMEQRQQMAEERFIWQERGDRAGRFNRQYSHFLDDLRAYADKAIASGQPIDPVELRGWLGESMTDSNETEQPDA